MNYRPRPWRLAIVALAAMAATGACNDPPHAATKASTAAVRPTSAEGLPRPNEAPAEGPLEAPKTSSLEDVNYFNDLAKVDPGLATYVNTWSDVALRALITDGSAFCAFLDRDKSVDDAMTSLVMGARSIESQSHLPMSVKTFNAVDAVALVALCPGEVKLLPPEDRAKVRHLGVVLGKGAN